MRPAEETAYSARRGIHKCDTSEPAGGSPTVELLIGVQNLAWEMVKPELVGLCVRLSLLD